MTKAKPKEEKQPLTKQINSIIQGYLSSDDEEDEEEEVNSKETKQESSQTINIDELTLQALAQHQNLPKSDLTMTTTMIMGLLIYP